jgi:hypothetical protein
MRWLAIISASIFMAAVFSLVDFAWPQNVRYETSPCPEIFEVVNHEQDRDGNEVWQILVTPYMQENGTDSMCLYFARCVGKLIRSADGMGAVQIVNPENEWVPSAWRWIESSRLALLEDDEDAIEYVFGYYEHFED